MSELNVTKIENEADSSAVEINRKASDGDIIDLQKDGTTVGTIGVDGGDNLYLTGESGNTGGIYMNDAAVSPAYQGAERDAYYNLGKAPARWKDLYLSGGVYLGGTGAANYLDDYEEGTWTPALDARSTAFSSVTYNTTYTLGLYKKIGKVMYITCRVQWTAFSGGSGELRIVGFPLSAISGAANQSTHIINAFGSGFSGTTPDAGRWHAASILELSGNGANTTVSQMPSSGYVLAQGFYMTD